MSDDQQFVPKSTVHERFTEWVASGALERAWAVLLREYAAQATGANPTDRGKPGTTRHRVIAIP